jgi:hypothetical protein
MDGIGVEEALRRMMADEELDARLMPEAEQAVAETVAVEPPPEEVPSGGV